MFKGEKLHRVFIHVNFFQCSRGRNYTGFSYMRTFFNVQGGEITQGFHTCELFSMFKRENLLQKEGDFLIAIRHSRKF
jgi:hypothetical protein